VNTVEEKEGMSELSMETDEAWGVPKSSCIGDKLLSALEITKQFDML
jgi:hypothetical protein